MTFVSFNITVGSHYGISQKVFSAAWRKQFESSTDDEEKKRDFL